MFPELPGIETGGVKCSVSESEDAEECTRRLSARIMALSEESLTAALDAAMRTVNETATLTEALLEARSVRLASPQNFPASTRKRLTRDLKEAGFESCFAPAWTPIPGTVWGDAPVADIALGTRGLDNEFRDFLEGHPSWKMASGCVESVWRF